MNAAACEKLVRDLIPRIILQNGDQPVTRVLGAEEYHAQLRKKLTEEVREYLASEAAEKLADILEVVYALAQRQGIGAEALEAIRLAKRNRNGGFAEKIYLERVIPAQAATVCTRENTTAPASAAGGACALGENKQKPTF